MAHAFSDRQRVILKGIRIVNNQYDNTSQFFFTLFFNEVHIIKLQIRLFRIIQEYKTIKKLSKYQAFTSFTK